MSAVDDKSGKTTMRYRVIVADHQCPGVIGTPVPGVRGIVVTDENSEEYTEGEVLTFDPADDTGKKICFFSKLRRGGGVYEISPVIGSQKPHSGGSGVIIRTP